MTAASLLIDCWESASRSGSWPPAVAILLPVTGGDDPEALARLPVGRRDAGLLDLRRSLFGDCIEALASCPACGQAVDLDLRVSELQLAQGAERPLAVELDGWTVEFRLPDGRDLEAAAMCTGVDAARATLIDRCVLRVAQRGRRRPLSRAPVELIGLMEEAMVAADPQADLQFQLTCPECGTGWDAGIDLESFVAAEVATAGRRLLREVHRLAGAYGWGESEILALSAQRRRAYLELVAVE